MFGIGKPDPRYFENVLNRIGANRENIVMIGNGTSDISGAENSGIKSILKEDNSNKHLKIKANFSVEKLTQIPQLLSLM